MTDQELELVHIFDPTRYLKTRKGGVRGDRAGVHLAQKSTGTSLCGLVHVYREVNGQKYRQWHEVDLPADCIACTKALEIILRRSIGALDSAQLEEVLMLTFKLRANS